MIRKGWRSQWFLLVVGTHWNSYWLKNISPLLLPISHLMMLLYQLNRYLTSSLVLIHYNQWPWWHICFHAKISSLQFCLNASKLFSLSIVYSMLWEHLLDHSPISDCQCSFQKQKSTTTALLFTTQEWLSWLNQQLTQFCLTTSKTLQSLLSTGKFPQMCKVASVVPIPKSNNKNYPSNYRTISLYSVRTNFWRRLYIPWCGNIC